MKIKKTPNQDVPYDLLFLADEDDKQISKYRDKATFWAAYEDDTILGMIGLVETEKHSSEIVCLAVYEQYENKKIGTKLVQEAIAHSKEKKYKEVVIKTGNCGIKQLYLYQRCGFRFDSINKDYFPKHYPEPFSENGIPCLDQIVLKYVVG